MKTLPLLLAATALLALGACNKTKTSATPEATGPVVAVAPPTSGDWSEVTTASPSGGFIMGNPNAKVKLVEYGSMTCPHCAEFDEKGAKPLIDNYVKNGKVSWEYRNFVRDPYDLAAALVARCNGEKSFFGLTRAMYASQKDWIGKLQTVPPAQMEAISKLPPQQQFVEVGKLTGFPQFAALRGVPAAKANACLADTKQVDKLVQMNSDAVSDYNIPGTPSFLLNGALLTDTAAWQSLEPKLKAAVG